MDKRTFTYGEMENLAYLAGDLMDKISKVTESKGHITSRFDDSRDIVSFLIEKAIELEVRLGGVDEDEGQYDYIEELEKFEEEIIKEVGVM